MNVGVAAEAAEAVAALEDADELEGVEEVEAAVFAATASGTPAMELPEKGLLSRPLASPASSRSARVWETSAGVDADEEADVVAEEDANEEENEEAKAGSETGAVKAAVSAAGRPPTAAVLMRTARSGRAVRGSIGRCIVSKFQRVCLLACGLPLYLRDVFGNVFQRVRVARLNACVTIPNGKESFAASAARGPCLDLSWV